MALARTTAGTVYRDTFPADGALAASYVERDVNAGAFPADGEWDVADGRARVTSPDDLLQVAAVEQVGPAAAQFMTLSARLLKIEVNGAIGAQHPFLGLIGKWDSAADSFYRVELRSDVIKLLLQDGGVLSELGSFAYTIQQGVVYEVKLELEAGRQRVYVNNTLRIDAADATLDAVAGKAGLYGVVSGDALGAFDDFTWLTGNTLTVTGLTPGWILEVGTSQAIADGGGVAEVDLTGISLPFANFRILDDTETLVEQAWPEGGVTGGDVFAYSGAAPGVPLVSQPIGGLEVDDTVAVAWSEPATGLNYEGEYTTDGVAWNPLFPLQAALTYDADTSGWPETTDAQVRVRAHDGVQYGDWGYSGVFFVAHAAPEVSDIKQFQADFDVAGMALLGTSVTRRPDAISLDYLTTFTLGPIAESDPSAGLIDWVWQVWIEGPDVFIRRQNTAGNAWDPRVTLFSYNPADPAGAIVEMDAAFEQNGRAVVAAERADGSLWLFWYDPTVPGYTFVQLAAAGRTPRIVLDNPSYTPDSDVLLFYINAAETLVHRLQRDRYAIEIATPGLAWTQHHYLEDAFLGQGRRMRLLYSVRDPVAGTYQIFETHSTLYPVIIDPEGGRLSDPEVTFGELKQVVIPATMDAEGGTLMSPTVLSGTLELAEISQEPMEELTLSASLTSISLPLPVIVITMDEEGATQTSSTLSGTLEQVVIDVAADEEGVTFTPSVLSGTLAVA